jgi:fructose-1,6-bisphosphatase/inositol monophosphatase family enzyme
MKRAPSEAEPPSVSSPLALRESEQVLGAIREAHERMRDAVLAACETRDAEDLAAVVAHEGGDSVFAIDRVSEQVLLERFAELATDRSFELVAEGLGERGSRKLGAGSPEMLVIVDPIDGTRGLMYQKRSAWILTGVAPYRAGARPTLTDIELAVQTEIPLVKQHLCDTLWAIRGSGAQGERYNRISGERRPLRPSPSRAASIAQGFGGVASFFPGALAQLGAIGDAVAFALLGRAEPGRALAFEDQYISSGGQLYELMMGHDRWIADLRPLIEPLLRAEGRALGLCCHPYDLCTELIAREAGVIVESPSGEPLTAPLDVFTDVSWVGYANRSIAASVAPALVQALAAVGIEVRKKS